jgi:hypothetical protein
LARFAQPGTEKVSQDDNKLTFLLEPPVGLWQIDDRGMIKK